MERKKWLFFISFLFFIGLFFAYHARHIYSIDLQILRFFEGIRTPIFNRIFITITTLGSIKILLPLCVFITIYFLIKRQYIEFILLWLAFWSSRGVNFIVKEVVERERPPVIRLVEVEDFSFPSGHSMNSIVTLGFICYLFVATRQLNSAKKTSVSLLTGFTVLLIVISRLYIGVHYPTDVLAGLSLGCCLLLIYIQLYRFLRKNG